MKNSFNLIFFVQTLISYLWENLFALEFTPVCDKVKSFRMRIICEEDNCTFEHFEQLSNKSETRVKLRPREKVRYRKNFFEKLLNLFEKLLNLVWISFEWRVKQYKLWGPRWVATRGQKSRETTCLSFLRCQWPQQPSLRIWGQVNTKEVRIFCSKYFQNGTATAWRQVHKSSIFSLVESRPQTTKQEAKQVF